MRIAFLSLIVAIFSQPLMAAEPETIAAPETSLSCSNHADALRAAMDLYDLSIRGARGILNILKKNDDDGKPTTVRLKCVAIPSVPVCCDRLTLSEKCTGTNPETKKTVTVKLYTGGLAGLTSAKLEETGEKPVNIGFCR